MSLVTIYGLYSSSDRKIRYVGQTNQKLDYRLTAHIKGALAYRSRAHSAAWIRQQLSSGHRIFIFQIEHGAERNSAEQRWISWYKRHGADLTNISPGGDGALGPRSAEHRAAISAALKGLPKTQQHRHNLSLALKGKPLPVNFVAASKAGLNRIAGVNDKPPSFYGMKHSGETKRKISAANIGKKRSEDSRLRMREASARRWTQEARAEAARKTRAHHLKRLNAQTSL